MKKVLAAAMLIAFAVSPVIAADPVFKAKNGDVTFPAVNKKGATIADHASVKIPEPFGKNKAHELCKGCHETKKAGPAKCGECHKKK